jgi:hypothetical protein
MRCIAGQCRTSAWLWHAAVRGTCTVPSTTPRQVSGQGLASTCRLTPFLSDRRYASRAQPSGQPWWCRLSTCRGEQSYRYPQLVILWLSRRGRHLAGSLPTSPRCAPRIARGRCDPLALEVPRNRQGLPLSRSSWRHWWAAAHGPCGCGRDGARRGAGRLLAQTVPGDRETGQDQQAAVTRLPAP